MPFIERETGGFLPSNPTQVEPDFWTSVDMAVYQAIPDWPIFQTETVSGLLIGGAVMFWMHRKTRPKPISQERQRLR